MAAKRSSRKTPPGVTLLPYTNLPKRTQFLLGMLIVSLAFATIYFAGTDATIASITATH